MFQTPKRSNQKTPAVFNVPLASVYQMQMHYPGMLQAPWEDDLDCTVELTEWFLISVEV